MTKTHKKLIAPVCALLISLNSASGGGFALQEQSVSGLGNAFAGGAAAAEDNSAIYTNPAALTLLDNAEVQLGVHFIGTDADISNLGTTTMGIPTQGSNQNSGEGGIIPNLYYSQPINEKLTLGLGVMAPFGLSTDWGDQWFGRYVADYSELQTVDVQPTLAYKINDQWSVGFGINYSHTSANLTNAVDMGLVFLNAVNTGAIPVAAVPAAVLGDIQANIGGSKYDGYSDLEGDGSTWSWNAGVLFQPNDSTRIGFHYRSGIEVDIEGDVDFEVGALSDFLGGVFPDGPGYVDLELPSITNFSIHHQINDQWSIMADAQYTTWSVFETLTVRFGQPTPPTSETPENWNDVWRYAVGTSYQMNEQLKLRAGISFEETPVPSAEFRSPRIPDADRIWYSCGAEYVFNDNFRMNAAASYISPDKGGINNDTHASAFHMVGELDATVTIFSISGIYSF